MSRSLLPRLALLVGLVSCGAGPEEPTAGPNALPRPDLSGVDADVRRAIDEARRAVEAAPDSATAWGALGTRYFAHEFEDAAVSCFERAEVLEPDKAMWPYRRAWARFDEYPEEALPAFARTLELYPDYAPAWEAAGRVLFRLGRTAEARAHLERATELEPTNAHAWTVLGQLALERDDVAAARAHLERALSINERQVEAHLALAQVLFALGDAEAGKVHAERARKLPPKTPREDWLAGLDVSPAGPRARTEAGLKLLRAGRAPAAAQQFRIALESHPGSTVARIGLANALAVEGQREAAREVLREGLSLNPEATDLRSLLDQLERP